MIGSAFHPIPSPKAGALSKSGEIIRYLAALLRGSSLEHPVTEEITSVDIVKEQIKIANDIVENDLSVRETEKLINNINKKIIDKNPAEKQKLLQFDKLPEVEKTVSEYLGTLVKIKVGRKKGTIEILFGSLKDFERIVRRIVTSK